MLPLFYQELLGYTAFTAGLVVAPRGLGAICGMPVIGLLSNKVDPRYLLTFGFLTFGLTTLYFGYVTTEISPTTLFLPILITGFGLSFVFVPISTAAYGTLRNEQIGNASGLFNLMRNVGGSIGISIATTLLVRRADVHQNEIINHVPRTGLAFQNSVQGSQHFLSGYFGASNALAPRRPVSTASFCGRHPRGLSSTSFAGSRCSAPAASSSSGSSRRSSPAAAPRGRTNFNRKQEDPAVVAGPFSVPG